MPAYDAPDMRQGYRMAGKLREIALGMNEHPADDPDLTRAAELGHAELVDTQWRVTNSALSADEDVA